jgi:hypothetical protein
MHCYDEGNSAPSGTLWRRGNRQFNSAIRFAQSPKEKTAAPWGGGLVAEGTKIPLFQFYQST